ncbi:hypothetical protein FACS189499_06390 [Clostridia bacterium]|nr:hypothetical protein FACS189499_06390 [Clostridia bacterium]
MIADSKHNFVMENRTKLILTGVRELENSGETEVCLFTEAGGLKISGENLVIKKFAEDTGELELHGKFVSAKYTDLQDGERVPNNFLAKIFK